MIRLKTIKAELAMRVAGFISQNHSNPVLTHLAALLSWMNRGRYGKGALDFLENEDSIDHLDYSDVDENT
ncbi:MAG: hypothetical protein AAF542_05090 [Pseudomonadota bacterium]